MAEFRFVVFESVYNKKYLRLTNGKDEGLRTGFVKFDGEEVVNPVTKFELEPAKSADAKWKGLKHIRSCYNNKYLVRDVGANTNWIIAGAEKPEEDQSKPSCTLFKPEGNQLTYGFRHVQLGRFACLWRAESMGMYLGSESPDKDSCHLFTLVNWENLVFFPQRVAFKGNNGKYLCLRNIERHPYLQFVEDTKDETAEYEVATIGNGHVRIRSIWNGKFWRRSPNWIWADSSDNSSDNPDELFWPVKIRDNVVALQNMGNMNFCKRLTTEGKTNCLNAGTPFIAPITELVVEDAVVSRHIYNIDFKLSNSRIYQESLIALVTGGASNESYGTESRTLTLKLVYKDIKTNTWRNNISLTLGAKTTIQLDAIPLIVEGKVELSTEITNAFQWGETLTTETDVETSYTVNVPPRTKTVVTLKAIKAFCDVSFSYTQSDVLSNGKNIIKTMRDGVFNGANYFNFNFEEVQQNVCSQLSTPKCDEIAVSKCAII
ncbi:hypothetical protein FRX31_005538 [Thalictrum thalictroides]|uniref:Agglutinin domain-containing protein n=1 Tax=Thalictrum thalictroides TaxID=46969 RepID=A0A7J6X7P3_THATH|nr:hypothetical protein FRX31_005538 [Thalictrum thalictroides]